MTGREQSWWRRRKSADVHGDVIDPRERYIEHDCKVPGPHDSRDDYRGSLADGARWRCRKCGSVWELSNYWRFSHKWFRREDPGRDAFDASHDDEGRLLTPPARETSPSVDPPAGTGAP